MIGSKPTMKTHQLAEAAGISEQAVRDYEANNLLPLVSRLANGYRNYTARHLAALLTIRALRAASYTRAEMVTIMNALHDRSIHLALDVLDRHHADLDARRRQIVVPQPVNAGHWQRASTQPGSVNISQAAAVVGVRPSTLRFWESLSLLTVDRNASSGFREYDESDLDRLHAIRQMRSLDFDWETVRLMSSTRGNPQHPARRSASERQLETLGHASRDQAKATAMVWAYFLIPEDCDEDLVEAVFGYLHSPAPDSATS